MKKYFIFATLVWVLLLVAPILAQSQESNSDMTGTITSVNDIDVIAISGAEGNSVGRSFVGAVPGISGSAGPFPGYPLNNGNWQLYTPVSYKTLSMEEILNMKRKSGIGDALPWNWGDKRVRSTFLKKNTSKNNDDINIVAWWPKNYGHPGDRILGVITVIGDWLWPEELYLGLGLEEAKKKTGTKRVAIRVREIKEGVTKGLSFGSGGAAARVTMPSSNNDPVSVATGSIVGTNRVRTEEKIEFEIICLNDGSIDLPEKLLEDIANANKRRDNQPAPEVKVSGGDWEKMSKELAEILKNFSKQSSVVNIQMPPASALPPLPPPKNPCEGMPKLTILFDQDKSNIRDDRESSKIQGFAAWAKQNKECRFQVRGNANTSGGLRHNNDLGMNRAISVTKELAKYGVTPEQFVSGGEYNTVEGSEYSQADRRVVFEGISLVSGK